MAPLEPTDDPLALESLLRWYLAMGADASIDEVPHDRFAALGAPIGAAPSGVGDASQMATQTAPTKGRVAPVRDAPSPPRRAATANMTLDAATASADALIRQAEAIAAAAETLDELRASLETLPGCNLGTTASRMIFAGGTPGASIMLIAGAPDSDDERQGEAFAGANGRLLDAMLKAIGLDRSGVYLGNVIPWRPPGNRAPTPLELALCLPFTRRHIALAAPTLLVCLGEKAAQPLLDTKEPISRLRGRWMRHEGDTTTVKTLVTFAPDYLIKQPLQKRRAWADLRMLLAELRSDDA